VDGVLPFPAVSASSPILPNTPLGNITQIESTGFSNYSAAWASMTKRLSSGLQFDASYTWSKSLDTNSLNSSGFALQNGYDVAGNYGPSDFDARHRFVASAVYALPFTGSAWTRGWHTSTTAADSVARISVRWVRRVVVMSGSSRWCVVDGVSIGRPPARSQWLATNRPGTRLNCSRA
jgi:hypothetical protein